MSLTNSLTTQKQKEAEAAVEAAKKASDKEGIQMRVAAAFDAGSQGITLPKLPMLMVHPLYGRVASLSFSRDSSSFPHTGRPGLAATPTRSGGAWPRPAWKSASGTSTKPWPRALES